jgi:inorganic pyrophosphatase
MASVMNGKSKDDEKVSVVKLIRPLDIDDVKTHFPELIRATHHWFKIYKMPDGKPANHFAFDGQCKDKVIGKNHGYGC